MTKLLIERGVKVNAVLYGGRTALHFVGDGAHWNLKSTNIGSAIIEHLICHGADPTISDDEGYTTLLLAARSGNFEAVECILRHWCRRSNSNVVEFNNMQVEGNRILDFALE